MSKSDPEKTNDGFVLNQSETDRFRREIAELKEREQQLEKSWRKEVRANTEPIYRSRAMRYTWLGVEFAAIFVGSVYLGHWLDGRLGTKPWLVLVGICAGFGIALYRLILVARSLEK